MDLQKRITKIEQTATDAENTAYKIPHSEVEKLDFVQRVLLFDYSMWQNPNVEIVDDPNEEERFALMERLIHGEMTYSEYQKERKKYYTETPLDEVGKAIGRNKQNPFDVEKWLEEVSI